MKGGETIKTMGEAMTGGNGKGVMMIEGRVLKPTDVIHDLLEALEESSGAQERNLAKRGAGSVKIYDLVDVVEKKPRMAFVDAGLHEEIMRRATEIAEKVAREIVPAVAERVIREEIEKLKKGL